MSEELSRDRGWDELSTRSAHRDRAYSPRERRLSSVVVLLSYALFYLPWINGPIDFLDLDGAWKVMFNGRLFGDLSYRFGSDLAFTMGPLGFLRVEEYYPGNLIWQFAWATLVIAASWLIYRTLVAGRSRFEARLTLVVFLALPIVTDGRPQRLWAYMTILLVVAAAWSEDRRRWRGWEIAGWLVSAGASLIIFRELVAASVAVVAITGIEWLRHRRLSPALLVFTTALFGFWLWSGNRLVDFPGWVRDSAHFAAGYTDTFFSTGPLWQAGLVLIGFAGLSTLWWFVARRRGWLLTIWLGGSITGLFLLAFKWSFVRQATVSRTAMVGCFLLVPALFFGLELARQGRRRLATSAVIASIVVATILASSTHQFGGRFREFVRRPMVEVSAALRVMVGQGPRWSHRHERNRLEAVHALPGRFKNRWIHDEPVDWFGNRSAILLAREMNYRPRPVFQRFAAFSPHLAERNAQFYRSDAAAPPWVVIENDAFQQYPVGMLDSLAFRELLQCYEVRDRAPKFVLLERDRCRPFDRLELISRQFAFGEPIELGNHADRYPLWIEVDFDQTIGSTLLKSLFRPRRLAMTVTYSNGKRRELWVSPPVGQTGFLLSPLVETSPQIERLFGWPESSLGGLLTAKKINITPMGTDRLPAPSGGAVRIWALERVD